MKRISFFIVLLCMGLFAASTAYADSAVCSNDVVGQSLAGVSGATYFTQATDVYTGPSYQFTPSLYTLCQQQTLALRQNIKCAWHYSASGFAGAIGPAGIENGAADTSWALATVNFAPDPYMYQQGQSGPGGVFSYSYSGGEGMSCTYFPSATPAPSASLAANPTSITSGNASTLTWSSTNATSCAGTNFSTGNATSGSTTVRPGSSTTYQVTCSGSGGSDSARATVSVSITSSCVSYQGNSCTSAQNSCGMTNSGSYNCDGSCSATPPSDSLCTSGKSDLTAINGVQSSDAIPTAGTPTTLTGHIRNQGSATTNNGSTRFRNLFQRATNAQGANAVDIGNDTSPALAAGGSDNSNITYAFPSGGTWYVRECANESSAGVLDIVTNESNTGNNCGAWSAISVADGVVVTPPPPPTSVCTGVPAPTLTVKTTGAPASSVRIPQGGATNVTVAWGASGTSAGNCIITGSDGYSNTLSPDASCNIPSGSVIRQPTTQTTYVMTCDTHTATALVNVVPNITEF